MRAAEQMAADNARRPAVIVIEGAESADPDALRDLILVLSEVCADRCKVSKQFQYIKRLAE